MIQLVQDQIKEAKLQISLPLESPLNTQLEKYALVHSSHL